MTDGTILCLYEADIVSGVCDVLGPLRVMAPCMAMGEAAGVAAAQAPRTGIPFAAANTGELRDQLGRQGAILLPGPQGMDRPLPARADQERKREHR